MTQKNLQTKPSAGAMRAAKLTMAGSTIQFVQGHGNVRLEEMAQIIDRETGLTVLLDAAKEMLPENLAPHKIGRTLKRLRQVIAKVEGERFE